MSYDLYASLLKMHDTFRPSGAGVQPVIRLDRPELRPLDVQWGLTALAGSGSALDRAMRVMDWLTTHVRHNGMCSPEGPCCAQTALAFAYDQPEKGVNCAWLAATLTECLLCLGIPARTVFIMPFAPYDCDNHVVTHVWADDRWVMLDPTCNCHVRSRQGVPLDLFSLRACLADQEEVTFSEGMRYNGQPYSAAEHRDYLAKDLYWFRTEERPGDPDSRMLVACPVGFDPCRFEQLNLAYRLRVQGDAPWLRNWQQQLARRDASSITCCAPEDLLLPPL